MSKNDAFGAASRVALAVDIFLMLALVGLLIAAQRIGARGDERDSEASKTRGESERTSRAAPQATAHKAPAPVHLALLAAGLSLLLPGVGHFLIRAPLRGLIWLVGWIVVGALSGPSHSPFVLILMLAAAVDAYLVARWNSPTDAQRTSG